MLPEWRIIVYQILPFMVNYPLAAEREERRRNTTKTVSKSPSLHVMLTLCAGQTWQRTLMPGAILSSKWLTSLNMTEEMHAKKRSNRKARVVSNTTPYLIIRVLHYECDLECMIPVTNSNPCCLERSLLR